MPHSLNGNKNISICAGERGLQHRGRRQDIFHIDPLGGVVAGVAGGAVAIFFLALD